MLVYSSTTPLRVLNESIEKIKVSKGVNPEVRRILRNKLTLKKSEKDILRMDLDEIKLKKILRVNIFLNEVEISLSNNFFA